MLIRRRGRDSNPRGSAKLPIRFRVGAVMTASVPLLKLELYCVWLDKLALLKCLIVLYKPGGRMLTFLAYSGYSRSDTG